MDDSLLNAALICLFKMQNKIDYQVMIDLAAKLRGVSVSEHALKSLKQSYNYVNIQSICDWLNTLQQSIEKI